MGNTLNKEKQTEEMARIASKCITSWLNNETPKSSPDYIAEALYNAGYRKADEVAREIIDCIDEWFMYCEKYSGHIIKIRLADVVEVRHGEWEIKSRLYRMIDDYAEEIYVECPFCKRTFYVPYEFDDEKTLAYARENYPYCHCGARMDGERREENG